MTVDSSAASNLEDYVVLNPDLFVFAMNFDKLEDTRHTSFSLGALATP